MTDNSRQLFDALSKMKFVRELSDQEHTKVQLMFSVDDMKAIKQAFTDTGYTNLANVQMQTLMTGQEWYDRFDAAYRELGGYSNDLYIDSIATAAARKAAGLTENKEV